MTLERVLLFGRICEQNNNCNWLWFSVYTEKTEDKKKDI